VNLPIHEDHRDLIGIDRREPRIVVNAQLDPIDVGLRAHQLDDFAGNVA
jgi:hypothetical protein